ncbi:hypothetical protein [Pseudorhodoplanes sp.]|uniref:hypothetical protein n=1 Tax=Pseudorhodoplanes sp. TaxID=1934341 RepID=UPI002CC08C29|nr:hypothetical protein [Pseudorhodoplanes sp.]HWV54026.1 hypothetical protein [Pseudorhodoplanes sp.]
MNTYGFKPWDAWAKHKNGVRDRLHRFDILEVGNGPRRVIAENVRREEEARLIAAAPDMLEALKALVDDQWDEMDDEDLQYELSQGNEMVRPYIAARAAIAKAEGRHLRSASKADRTGA